MSYGIYNDNTGENNIENFNNIDNDCFDKIIHHIHHYII